MIKIHGVLHLTVNGEPRETTEGTTIGHLVVALGAHPEGVAVAVNGEVVPRAEQAHRVLKDGDRVEIIRAVGGG
ncbi:MAG: sulfur carrier protein ThiS [Myxococcota bacterium]